MKYNNIPKESGIYLVAVSRSGVAIDLEFLNVSDLIGLDAHLYVGQSQYMYGRLQRHASRLRSGKHHNPRIQRAYDKYGAGSISCRCLEICSLDSITGREQYWFDKLGGFERLCNQIEPSDTSGGNLIFDKEDVDNILNMYLNGSNYENIAEIMGCGPFTIIRVYTGKRYSDLADPDLLVRCKRKVRKPNNFSPEMIRACLFMIESGYPIKNIANELNIGLNEVYRLLHSSKSEYLDSEPLRLEAYKISQLIYGTRDTMFPKDALAINTLVAEPILQMFVNGMSYAEVSDKTGWGKGRLANLLRGVTYKEIKNPDIRQDARVVIRKRVGRF